MFRRVNICLSLCRKYRSHGHYSGIEATAGTAILARQQLFAAAF